MSSRDNIIYIKNMVCDRCCMVVSEVFVSLGLEPVHVELGKVELAESPVIDHNEIDLRLQEKGFEILQDADEQLVDQIKASLIDFVRISEADRKQRISAFLQQRLHRDYSSLNFSVDEPEDLELMSQAIDAHPDLGVPVAVAAQWIARKTLVSCGTASERRGSETGKLPGEAS